MTGDRRRVGPTHPGGDVGFGPFEEMDRRYIVDIKAARATASASIGSDLSRSRQPWRVSAMSRVGTRTTGSPATIRSRSKRRVR